MVSKFLKVKCKCGHQQVIFEKPATVVKCLKCGEVLAEPRGGKGRIMTKITAVIK
jgi:small subunit ribosomal protein S27e